MERDFSGVNVSELVFVQNVPNQHRGGGSSSSSPVCFELQQSWCVAASLLRAQPCCFVTSVPVGTGDIALNC